MSILLALAAKSAGIALGLAAIVSADPTSSTDETDPLSGLFTTDGGDPLTTPTTAPGDDPVQPQDQIDAYIDALNQGEASGRWNVLIGGATFSDMSHHPAFTDNSMTTRSTWAGQQNSHAAGGLQFQPATYRPIAQRLGLPDFSEASQRAAGVALIKQFGAYDDIIAGNIASANFKLLSQWASIGDRGSDWYVSTFENAGGTLA